MGTYGGLLRLDTFPQLLYGVRAGLLARHGHRRAEALRIDG